MLADMYEAPTFHDADSILVAENNLKDAQGEIDRLRGRQLVWLKMVVRHRGIVRDGYRSLIDWIASRLDIPHTVARDLAYLARRLDDDRIDLIARGHLPFDRTVAEQRLIQAGASPTDVATSAELDLAGVAKLATRFRKLSRSDEQTAFERQYVNLRVSEDGNVWHLSGRLTATDGQLVRQALDRRSDQIPPLTPDTDPESELTPAQKQAIGLTTMAQDDLDQHLQPGDPAGREPVIMLIKDETLADQSTDTQGVELFAGPRVGPQTVERSRRTRRTRHHPRQPDHPNRNTPTPDPQTAPPSRPRKRPQMRHRLLPERLPAPNPPHHPQKRRRTRHGRQPGHPVLVPPPHRHPPTRTPNRPPHTTTPPPPPPTPNLAPLPTPHQPRIPQPPPAATARLPGLPRQIPPPTTPPGWVTASSIPPKRQLFGTDTRWCGLFATIPDQALH